ncbi:MAG: hypothetical protein AB1487_12675 [Thermodesulfobacteriota bacterium]
MGLLNKIPEHRRMQFIRHIFIIIPLACAVGCFAAIMLFEEILKVPLGQGGRRFMALGGVVFYLQAVVMHYLNMRKKDE